MENIQKYSTWVEVDLGAIKSNVHYIREKTGVQVMAVVKANGYGHGAIPVARAALKGGASWCGVARPEEAAELRRAGIECPILLLGYTAPARLEEMIASQVSLTVWTTEQIQEAAHAAVQAKEPARLHIKVDTGMSRLGARPQETAALGKQVVNMEWVLLEGVFTHFARADDSDPSTSRDQEEHFQQALEALQSEGIQPLMVHAANSAAGLSRPSAAFNLVRAGIAIYGLQPSAQWPLPADFRPALTWKTVLAQVKTLPAGRGISYGHIYTTSKEECIGTLPVGYADGFRRTPGNQVLVGGKLVPVVGRVCMDQVMVLLDEVPEAKPGDEVVIIGKQGKARRTAEEVAQAWGTINYEVVCGIGPRVPRIFYE